MKISEKIQAAYDQDKTIFSFEFFPPRTQDGIDNLFDKLDRFASLNPAFCDITWGAGGSTADLTLEIADKMQNMVALPSCFINAELAHASDLVSFRSPLRQACI